MDISIVIPAFNEEKKIGYDVEAAAVFIDEESVQGEVIVVDDGSTDKTAAEARSVEIPSAVDRNVIRLDENQGKGCIRLPLNNKHIFENNTGFKGVD